MKTESLFIKVSSAWKSRVKAACNHLSMSMAAFVIQAVNEKLEKMGL